MARRRRRHEARFSVWTFVAPVALIVAAVIFVNVVRGAVDEVRSADTAAAGTTAAEQATTQGGASTGAEKPGRRRFHTVRVGETLSDIAEQEKTTVAQIVRMNPDIDPDAILPGQRLRVA